MRTPTACLLPRPPGLAPWPTFPPTHTPLVLSLELPGEPPYRSQPLTQPPMCPRGLQFRAQGDNAETPSRRAFPSPQLGKLCLLPTCSQRCGDASWPAPSTAASRLLPPTAPPARGGAVSSLTRLPGARRPPPPGLDKEQGLAHWAPGISVPPALDTSAERGGAAFSRSHGH